MQRVLQFYSGTSSVLHGTRNFTQIHLIFYSNPNEHPHFHVSSNQIKGENRFQLHRITVTVYERMGTHKHYCKVSWQNPLAILQRDVTCLIPLPNRCISKSILQCQYSAAVPLNVTHAFRSEVNNHTYLGQRLPFFVKIPHPEVEDDLLNN